MGTKSDDTGCIIPDSVTLPDPEDTYEIRSQSSRRRSSGWCADGIFKTQNGVGVCCAKSCGTCGGSGCGGFPGGKWNCCADAIAKDGDNCTKSDDTGCRIPDSVTLPDPQDTYEMGSQSSRRRHSNHSNN